MDLTTGLYNTDLSNQKAIGERGFFIRINNDRESELILKMRDLEYQMRVLEDFMRDYWSEGPAPEIYRKLIEFLDKKFEKIDKLFLSLDTIDPSGGRVILDEIENIIVTLERRIVIVEKFLMGDDVFDLIAC